MNKQEHLLVCLSEECMEVAKDISKALRFGLEDRNVLDPTGPTNRERICCELNDLMAIINMCESAGILPVVWKCRQAIAAKEKKVKKFMKYAQVTGSLQP